MSIEREAKIVLSFFFSLAPSSHSFFAAPFTLDYGLTRVFILPGRARRRAVGRIKPSNMSRYIFSHYMYDVYGKENAKQRELYLRFGCGDIMPCWDGRLSNYDEEVYIIDGIGVAREVYIYIANVNDGIMRWLLCRSIISNKLNMDFHDLSCKV